MGETLYMRIRERERETEKDRETETDRDKEREREREGETRQKGRSKKKKKKKKIMFCLFFCCCLGDSSLCNDPDHKRKPRNSPVTVLNFLTSTLHQTSVQDLLPFATDTSTIRSDWTLHFTMSSSDESQPG